MLYSASAVMTGLVPALDCDCYGSLRGAQNHTFYITVLKYTWC